MASARSAALISALALLLAIGQAHAQFNDIIAIKFNASQSTEVHRLDGSTNYKAYNLEVPTALKSTARSSYRHLISQTTGDLFAIKYNGASGTTEVHVLPATSKYIALSLETGTPLEPSGPGTFDFALGPNDDLYAIKFNGSSSFVEVYILTAKSSYTAYSVKVTALPSVKFNEWQFLVNGDGDLYGIKFNGESTFTELHVLSAASGYQSYTLETATGFPISSRTTWTYLLDPADNLVGIKYNGASGFTEVHQVSKASNYLVFSLERATTVKVSSRATFQFGLRNNLNLVAIKHLGASNSTEVQVLAAPVFQTSLLQTATVLPVTPDPDSMFQFTTNTKGDLYGIKYNGASGFTEIYGLTAASKYANFSVQAPTALPPSSPGLFTFAVDDSANLWAIKFLGASNSTEVQVLTAASKYQKFKLQTATILPVTSASTWTLAVDISSGDLYGIKYNGSSKTTEVHVVSASSGYKKYSLEQATALPPSTPAAWDFSISETGDLYGYKYNGASKTTEVHVVSAASNYKSFSLQTATVLPPTTRDSFELILVPKPV